MMGPRAKASFAHPVAALLVCLIGAGIVYFGIVVPLETSMRTRSEAIATAAALQARLRLVAEIDTSAATGAASSAADLYNGDYLPGDSDALATGGLQGQLRSLIVNNASELTSTQALPERRIGGVTLFGVRVLIRASLDHMQRIVHSIETSRPLLFIERAQIRSDIAQGITPAVSGIGSVRVVAELDVYGGRLPIVRSGGARP